MVTPRSPIIADTTPMQSWQGILCPEPPPLRGNTPKIAAQAAKMLEDRLRRYPFMVKEGRITKAVADDEIKVWSLIASDWHWIMTGEGEPAPIEKMCERRAAIDKSLANLADIHREHGDFTMRTNFIAHLIIAMRWHLEPERGCRDIYWHASITHDLRKRAARDRQWQNPQRSKVA